MAALAPASALVRLLSLESCSVWCGSAPAPAMKCRIARHPRMTHPRDSRSLTRSWSTVASTCPSLAAPSNGQFALANDMDVPIIGGVATYTCNIGYFAVGKRSATCLSNRTWSTGPPSCSGASSWVMHGGTYVTVVHQHGPCVGRRHGQDVTHAPCGVE